MAIKVIRICDECDRECEQIIDENEKTVECPVAFECSDCILKKIRRSGARRRFRSRVDTSRDSDTPQIEMLGSELPVR